MRRHWLTQAKQVQLGTDAAANLIKDIVRSNPQVINAISKSLPKIFSADATDLIFNGVRRKIKKF